MALAITVRFDFTDEVGKKSFTEVNVPTGFTIAQYVTFAQSMGQLLANVSQGRLTSASINVSLDISGATIKAIANTVADIAEKGHYIFNSIVAGFRKLVKIPARVETDEIAGSDSLNQADVQIAAYAALVEDGFTVTGGTILCTDTYMQDLVALVSAQSVNMATA